MKKVSVQQMSKASNGQGLKKKKADAFDGLDFEKLVRLTVTQTSETKKTKNKKQ